MPDDPLVDRRQFLRRLGAAGLAALAGCAGPGVDSPTATGATSPTSTAHMTPTAPTPSSTATSSPTATTTTARGGRVTEVAAGPEGRLRFVPDRVEIAVGDTVRWTFESPGHNVTTKPGASNRVRNPPGAEPFASYEGNQHYLVVPAGETFEHTFTVPGEYVYVCEPHVDEGMIGTVVVREG